MMTQSILLIELELVKISEGVSLLLFVLEHPIVWDNRRVSWEAPVQI